jgi:hypothetical protein
MSHHRFKFVIISMKTFHLITMMFAFVYKAYASASDCLAACSETALCASDPTEQSSYCKDWQTIPVCFGLYVQADGSYCYQPNDPTCDDMTLPPLLCTASASTTVAPPASTTVAATTAGATTVAPVI